VATETLSIAPSRQNRFHKLFKKPFSGGKKSHSVSQSTLSQISVPGSPKDESRGSALLEMTDPLQVRSHIEHELPDEYLSDGQHSSDEDDENGLHASFDHMLYRNNMSASNPALFASTNQLHEQISDVNNIPTIKIDVCLFLWIVFDEFKNNRMANNTFKA